MLCTCEHQTRPDGVKLFTDPIFIEPASDRCVSKDLECICCIFHLYVYFLMDTNSRYSVSQFQRDRLVSGSFGICCPVWYGRFHLFKKTFSEVVKCV